LSHVSASWFSVMYHDADMSASATSNACACDACTTTACEGWSAGSAASGRLSWLGGAECAELVLELDVEFPNTTPRSNKTCTRSLESNAAQRFNARFFCFFLFFKSVATLLASFFNARCLARSSLSASFSRSGLPPRGSALRLSGGAVLLLRLGSGASCCLLPLDAIVGQENGLC